MGDEYMGDDLKRPGGRRQTPPDPHHRGRATPGRADDGLIYNKAQTELLFCPRGRVTAGEGGGVRHRLFMCFDLTSVILPSTLKIVKEQAFPLLRGPDGLHPARWAGAGGEALVFRLRKLGGCGQYPGQRPVSGLMPAECKGLQAGHPGGSPGLRNLPSGGYEDGPTEILLPSTLTSIGSSALPGQRMRPA